MILRPLDPSSASNQQFVDAWPVIEHLQHENYRSCWMITQPSHAALSGDIAAKLTGSHIPQLDPSLIRAIALHDAGWGQPDAEAIVHSRSRSDIPLKSFIKISVPDFLDAWTQSIEIVQKATKIGGYMVSRHFWRLAEHRVGHADDTQADRKKLQGFLNSESARQKKLTEAQNFMADQLEQLTDLLQLCDLLSLYICCGAREPVELPKFFEVKSTLATDGSVYRLNPPMVERGTHLRFAALRYPPSESESSREFQVTFE